MKNKKVYVASIILLLVSLIVAAFLKLNYGNDIQTQNDTFANLNPPTEEEQRAGDKQKLDNELADKEASQSNNTSKLIKPIITSAGQFDASEFGSAVEVRTLITGIYESGGKCTAIFTQENRQLERESEAIQDATTTRCDVIVVPTGDFPTKGTWDLVVKYVSAKAQGQSDNTRIEIK